MGAIELLRSSFTGGGRDGDFTWMIEQPDHSRTLFVFNDNESQFYEHQKRLGTAHSCHRGGGNAAIRPYQCLTPPRATGIPTGDNGGYTDLAEAQSAIDDAIRHLDVLLASGQYDRVAISWNHERQILGTGIFTVDRTVLEYIVEQIEAVVSRY